MERKPNILDKIGRYIPGYTGYADREKRRSCDKVIREQIARQLAKYEECLQEQINRNVKARDLEKTHDLETCRKRINTLACKIKHAPYGESSFFSENQIKAEELQRLHDLDQSILSVVEDMLQSIQSQKLEDTQLLIVRIQEQLDCRTQLLQENK